MKMWLFGANFGMALVRAITSAQDRAGSVVLASLWFAVAALEEYASYKRGKK